MKISSSVVAEIENPLMPSDAPSSTRANRELRGLSKGGYTMSAYRRLPALLFGEKLIYLHEKKLFKGSARSKKKVKKEGEPQYNKEARCKEWKFKCLHIPKPS
eukprot:gene2489-1552_t